MSENKPLFQRERGTKVDLTTWYVPDFDEWCDQVKQAAKTIRKSKKVKKRLLKELSSQIQDEMDDGLLVFLTCDHDYNAMDKTFGDAKSPRLTIGIPVGANDAEDCTYNVDIDALVDRLIEENAGDVPTLRMWAGLFFLMTEKLQKVIEAADPERVVDAGLGEPDLSEPSPPSS